MRLLELDPHFLKILSIEPRQYQRIDNITEAQGIEFLCPKCFTQNGGRVGTHMVICWSRTRGTPENFTPGPGRWQMVGTGYADLSLVGEGSSSSVKLLSGCEWHGTVAGGQVSLT